MKLIESLRGIENSFTTVKKVSKKEITKTELSESLFKAASQIDERNYRTSFDLTNGYQKALEEAIEKINPDKRWFEVTDCDIRTTLLENHNNIEATIRRILNESEDDEVDIDDEEAIQRILDSNRKKEDYIFVDASGSTTKDKMIRATKEGLKKLPNAKVLYVSDFGIDEKLPQHGNGWCNPEIIGRYLSGKPINKAIFFTDEDYDSSKYDLGKIGVEVNTDLMSYNESLTEETIGADLSEYQKWVDYDMEHYGKISSNTFRKITEAGLSLVKDQYGDYEVIADRDDFAGIPCKKESCDNESLTEGLKELPSGINGLKSEQLYNQFSNQISKICSKAEEFFEHHEDNDKKSAAIAQKLKVKLADLIKKFFVSWPECKKQLLNELLFGIDAAKDNESRLNVFKSMYNKLVIGPFSDFQYQDLLDVVKFFTRKYKLVSQPNGDMNATALDKALANMMGYKVNVKESVNEGCLKEKVVHQGSKWVNKGPEGIHGEFTTKKAADAQRKAIASNYDDDDTSYIINVSKSDSPKYVKKFEGDDVVTSSKKDDAKKFSTKSSAEKFIKDKDITGKVITENIDDLGVDLGELQDLVDYDIKHYGEISEFTRKELEDAGLEAIKNGYGNYELIAEPYDGEYDESLQEDTVKQGSQWVNKGEEGTHGKFKTKKEADAQRKAMFANGYKAETLTEDDKDEEAYKKLKAGYSLADALK